tara:strand:- start:10752 stop:12278 length:1527 start_codon:yes stop_codon:yes gene_type:complete
MQQTIAILDFGSQYTQLIARRVRELNVYCEIMPFSKELELGDHIMGVIYSGSPFSVHDETSPIPDIDKLIGKKPLLAVCYGAQFAAKHFGGSVVKSTIREYGRAMLSRISDNKLFEGVSTPSQVWMSHGDTIAEVPAGFDIICETVDVKVAGFHSAAHNLYALQFHPEVYHTTDGLQILKNFVVGICGCDQSFTPNAFVGETIDGLKEKLGDDKVLLGLSGGVDSSVAAVLLDKAIGKNLTCIFVDNGLLRKDEYAQVLDSYKNMGLNVIGVDASEQFYSELAGISDPEHKRKTIGRVFIEVFEAESKKIEGVKWLAQGTIYPDVIESVSVNGPSVTIKSHHNVGGLPDRMNLKVVEPLRLLFKDEVRRVGKSLDMDQKILGRHPFPGPGLAIRILGDITREKVKMLQEVDFIFIDSLKKFDLYDSVWQAGAILLPVQSVGVMGDERTYENAVALRAVSSTDGMTADWCHLPYEALGKISNDIINKVNGINRVVYDISSKPPATIEWE